MRLIALVAAFVALAAAPAPAAVPSAPPPIRFSVAFGDGARLSAATSLLIRLAMAPGLPPVTEVRLFTPSGIDLSSSELGLATCKRPALALLSVMNLVDRTPCPGNALMGSGRALAELRFDPEEVYDGVARLALYSGESVGDKPGLYVIADTSRPIRTQLTYNGYLYVPPPGFGIGMAIQVRPIPQPPFGAPVALSSFRMVVGASDLRYVETVRGQPVSFHPRTVPLPARCPAEGFRFRAVVRLEGGRRLTKDAFVPCPQQ
ncbi:hypothetical protein [Baekduia sp. Peel2402]|uniref:hypothetical protein n=1 Tax=Baekduia sp. Peel2402 TaxID=3458296 RepID=UPI00403EE1A0